VVKVAVETADPTTLQADCLVGFVHSDGFVLEGIPAGLDSALGGVLGDLEARGEISGKLHETTIISTLGRLPARWLLLIGAGKRAEATVGRMAKLYGQAARHADGAGWRSLVAPLVPVAGTSVERRLRAAAAASVVGPLRLDLYKSALKEERPKPRLEEVTFCVSDGADLSALREAASLGEGEGNAVNMARELVARPANEVTPTAMAEKARLVAEAGGMEFRCLGRAEMEAKGMGCLLGVARGSVQEPKLFAIRYGRFEDAPVLGIVGKGITFDSGGITLKPGEGMQEMKADMAGAAAVIGAMQAIAALKPHVNVVGVGACAENLPDANAMKPGDVVRAMNGKTVECVNTDAEGRLVLADALCYAQQDEGATHLVDVATLTGACVVALGQDTAGAMGGPQEWVDRVVAAMRDEGEKVWQLPLEDEHGEEMKSDIADMKNAGGRQAGAITGAWFIKQFVNDGVPWVHLDVAGPATIEKDVPYMCKGGTGFGVRGLARLAEMLADG